MLCSKCHESAEALTDRGLCVDCHMEAEGRRVVIVGLARQQCEQAGVVQIDDDAQLSEGDDNGCYLQAWVWVDFDGTKFDKEKKSDADQACDECGATLANVIGCPDGAEICEDCFEAGQY